MKTFLYLDELGEYGARCWESVRNSRYIAYMWEVTEQLGYTDTTHDTGVYVTPATELLKGGD